MINLCQLALPSKVHIITVLGYSQALIAHSMSTEVEHTQACSQHLHMHEFG